MNRAANTVVGVPEPGVTVTLEDVVVLAVEVVDGVEAAGVDVDVVSVEPQPATAARATRVAASVAVRLIASPRKAPAILGRIPDLGCRHVASLAPGRRFGLHRSRWRG